MDAARKIVTQSQTDLIPAEQEDAPLSARNASARVAFAAARATYNENLRKEVEQAQAAVTELRPAQEQEAPEAHHAGTVESIALPGPAAESDSQFLDQQRPQAGAKAASSEPVTQPASLFGRVVKTVDGLIDSAAGYDEEVLARYGSATDQKRRRNIGRAILVATAVGALGWFAKIVLAFGGAIAFPLALTVAILYAVLSYSLESFFAANVDPFASVTSKIMSLTGRVLLSAVVALAGALPWVTISLKPAVELEMSKMALAEQSGLRKGLDDAYGLTALGAKAQTFQSELTLWQSNLATLPASIQAALDNSTACASAYAARKVEVDSQAVVINKRLAGLDRAIVAANAAQSPTKALEIEQQQLRRTAAKAAEELSAKKVQCQELKSTSEKARDDYVTYATEQRNAAQAQLTGVRKEEGAVADKVGQEKAKADQLVETTVKANASAEFSALLKILKTQAYAQFLAGLIFIGLLLIDALPLTLRLFSRPGPYDAEKRADEAIKVMRAEGRWLEAKMMHEARRDEMASEDLIKMVRAECRPHIRAITLHGVSSFLRRQVAKA